MEEISEYTALCEAHDVLLDKIESLSYVYAHKDKLSVRVELMETKAAARWIANRLREIEAEEYDKTLTGDSAV